MFRLPRVRLMSTARSQNEFFNGLLGRTNKVDVIAASPSVVKIKQNKVDANERLLLTEPE